MTARSRALLSPALLAVTMLAGCTVGPDYHRPEPRLADHWAGPAMVGEAADPKWWRSLNDPLLDALVEEMLAGNPNLREAQARLAEVRANRDAVRGGRLPQAQVSASGTETVLSENGQIPIGSIPGFQREFGLFDLGFDASWEIDLWGRRTRQIEGATARTEEAVMQVESTRLQLLAELTRAYVDLRLAQSEMAFAGETLAARTRLADLTALLAKSGEVSRIEFERARSDADNDRATLANAQASARAAALRVAVLVGAQPDVMLPRLEPAQPIPLPPMAIAPGLPSDLLRRRPDIRVAERDLAAATADVGVATADLFPRLSLSLAAGQQARTISSLFDSDSSRLQAGPGLAWPIFAGGTIRAQIHAANARVAGAAARFDAAVIGALSDSETAINRFDRSVAALDAAQSAAQREGAAFALSEQRASRGEDDQLALARASLSFIGARQHAEEARATAVSAAIGLHKALGGSWSSDTR